MDKRKKYSEGVCVSIIDNASVMMKIEKNYPGYLKSWERVRAKIVSSPVFEDKSDVAMVKYCSLYTALMEKTRFDYEIENFVFLAIYIHTLYNAAYNVENMYITKVQNYDSDAEKNLIELLDEIFTRMAVKPEAVSAQITYIKNEISFGKMREVVQSVLKKRDTLRKNLNACESHIQKWDIDSIYRYLLDAYGEYKLASGSFNDLFRQTLINERRQINTKDECVRLAKEYLYSGISYTRVIFKNGTFVEVFKNCESKKDAIECAITHLMESMDSNIEWFEYDDETVDGKKGQLSIIHSSPDRTVANMYWSGMEFDYIDRDIVLELRKKDFDEKEVDAVCVITDR